MNESNPLFFSHHLHVHEFGNVGEARRLVTAICRRLGFTETRTAEAAIVVTELATNLVKHTGGAGGDLVLCPMAVADEVGLEILCWDKGPGFANIAESLRDGCSTTGTLGIGLGAIRRLSSEFDLYTALGQGVVVLSRLWRNALPVTLPVLTVGAVCLPVHGEHECGDAWAMKQSRDTTLLMVADGLGHGPDAAIAANRAVAIFQKQEGRGPAELLEIIHAALRGSRGAAVAVAEVVPSRRSVRFAGVGNISGLIIAGETGRNMLSHDGTAGVSIRKIQEFTYDWPEGGLLVLHSDGVATKWSLPNYPGLVRKDSALIAAVLFRDFERQRDDSTLLVAKAAAQGERLSA
jgi:anti-sigma regulatory factor (Ser/Thr protein kinase)